MTWTPPTDVKRLEFLRETRSVAIVGASPNPARASYLVATYLFAHTDYEVWFVNPLVSEILCHPAYPTLADLPVATDMVDVFRRSEGRDGPLPED